ncbi:MAG: hypothetical protein KC476_09305 [Cyanobacteria bacterium HKST-UBA06]|nr:hypothetical protein [Cyanobacteria bacterium HKST-UBA06]
MYPQFFPQSFAPQAYAAPAPINPITAQQAQIPQIPNAGIAGQLAANGILPNSGQIFSSPWSTNYTPVSQAPYAQQILPYGQQMPYQAMPSYQQQPAYPIPQLPFPQGGYGQAPYQPAPQQPSYGGGFQPINPYFITPQQGYRNGPIATTVQTNVVPYGQGLVANTHTSWYPGFNF